MKTQKVVVVGGGAAGFFAAITCAETYPQAEVHLFEKSANVLNKVRISGGGRCNITNALEDPAMVASFFPRGEQELIGPFTRFGTKDTIEWFTSRGVELYAQDDNRVFPKTNTSKRVLDTLIDAAEKAGVILTTKMVVDSITPPSEETNNKWKVVLYNDTEVLCDRVILAAGGAPQMWNSLSKIGIEINKPVPALFSFVTDERFVDGLAGISFNDVNIQIDKYKRLKMKGDVLFTHWGISGPAILKLSSLAARKLSRLNYNFTLKIDWLPDFPEERLQKELIRFRQVYSRKRLETERLFNIPGKLWARIVEKAEIPSRIRWVGASMEHINSLVRVLKQTEIEITGKNPNKDEFVLCGGVDLKEVNFKTMESTRFPGLYIAGEVLDIDGLTGGFNLQAAWTTGYLAGKAVLENVEFPQHTEE